MFKNMCRFCRDENAKLVSLKNKQLIKLYERLLDTKLYCKDGKPKGFCVPCYQRLKAMYAFAQKCIQSEKIFKILAEQGLEPTAENVGTVHVELEVLPADDEIPRGRA